MDIDVLALRAVGQTTEERAEPADITRREASRRGRRRAVGTISPSKRKGEKAGVAR